MGAIVGKEYYLGPLNIDAIGEMKQAAEKLGLPFRVARKPGDLVLVESSSVWGCREVRPVPDDSVYVAVTTDRGIKPFLDLIIKLYCARMNQASESINSQA